MGHTKIRVLHVEDDVVDRMAFDRFVKENKLPYEHKWAQSVDQGQSALQTELFDVVLLDYILADGTAFDLFDKVPESVPIIIVTGSGDEEIAVQAMKAGATDYLIKDPKNHWLRTLPITVSNAIKAKHAQEALKLAHQVLETKVEERTKDLMRANEELSNEIERRKQIENALRESEERFRALAETTSDWIWEINSEGIFTYSSPQSIDILGFGPDQILGRSFQEIMTPANAKQLMPKLQASLESKKPLRNLEYTVKHKDGPIVYLEASGVPFLQSDGELGGYRGVTRDVTDRKHAEELLIRSERLKAIGELAAGVAHNFNNLLQIVVAGIGLALANLGPSGESICRRTLEDVLDSCRFGADTVSRLQDFAHSRPDLDVGTGSVVSLTHIVERALRMCEPFWKIGPEKDGIRISLEPDLWPEVSVRGKENELFELAVNLIKNAAEAMPNGGRIRIRTYQEKEDAILEVKDDGVGIPPDNISKIFQPFFTTKGLRGTGMGLASSYGIALRHHGSISVQSDVGKGATFTVRIPLEVEIPEQQYDEDQDMLLPDRILIIDDERLIVSFMEQELQRFSEHVSTAYSGEEGIRKFESEGADLVLSDLSMPGMSGLEVGKRILEISRVKGTAKPLFVIITGWSDQTLGRHKLAEAGVDAVLQKPLGLETLKTTIGNLLRRSRPTPWYRKGSETK